MTEWIWHDFELQQDDEDDSYYGCDNANSIVGEFVTRDFIIKAGQERKKYTISFLRILNVETLSGFVQGIETKLGSLNIPASGAWVVAFDRTDEKYSNAGNYEHVVLGAGEKVQVIREVACAIRDHYNLTRAGIYCWIAARDELKPIYDAALGINVEKESKIKVLPCCRFFNGLADNGRGYAIITKYY